MGINEAACAVKRCLLISVRLTAKDTKSYPALPLASRPLPKEYSRAACARSHMPEPQRPRLLLPQQARQIRRRIAVAIRAKRVRWPASPRECDFSLRRRKESAPENPLSAVTATSSAQTAAPHPQLTSPSAQ